MSGSWPPATFPHLSDRDYQITSPATRKYNCAAWSLAATDAKWWPDPFNIGRWVPNLPREETVEGFLRLFVYFGYEQCHDGALEEGYEKIAIYALRQADGSLSPQHFARQLPNGNWTSKLGDFEDIEHHLLESLNGASYGTPVCYVRRARRAP
jgi:hypothetical protein